MSKRKVEVIIDINEPPEVTAAVDQHDDVESYRVDQLSAADIEIDGIGFERKTIEDFTSSLKDGRIDEQSYKLDQRYEFAYILLDGDMVETESPFKSDMSGASLRGAMASLTSREDSGVQAVIPCSNISLLVDMAVRLARKHYEENGQEYIPQPDVEFSAPTTLMMYACIPGVGPDTAETLHQHYPTIVQFMDNADAERLQDLDGIGEKTALKIIEAFV